MVIGRLRSHVGGSRCGFALKALPDVNHLFPPRQQRQRWLPGHSGQFQVVWDHKFSLARMVE